MRPCDLSEQELKRKVPAEASWHNDYADSAWVRIANLPFRATEGDLLVMFSQFGEPVYVEVLKKADGGSRGSAILSYKDPRSAVLAVDNFDGTTLIGRKIGVDHMANSSELAAKLASKTSPYLVARAGQ